jgi:hypothetical protein
MSAWISSAALVQLTASSRSPWSLASFAPRSAATQHISLDETKCLRAPRTSQMPWSGLCQLATALSTARRSVGHTRSGR